MTPEVILLGGPHLGGKDESRCGHGFLSKAGVHSNLGMVSVVSHCHMNIAAPLPQTHTSRSGVHFPPGIFFTTPTKGTGPV